MTQLLNFTKNYYFLFLFLYFFTLPIAHTAAIQSISISLFIVCFFAFEFKSIAFKALLSQKTTLFLFGGLLVLALISLFFTPDLHDSLKEIRNELVRNFLLTFCLFYVAITKNDAMLKRILLILFCVFLFHTISNIVLWISYGGFPVRSGGFLDGGPGFAGERFGVWATYTLAFSIGLFYTPYKKIAWALFALSLLSIFANNTRATYVACLLILFAFIFLFNKSKLLKVMTIGLFCVILLVFHEYSDKFSNRYNLKNTLAQAELFYELPPARYGEIESKGLDHSITSRLAMWKSVIAYRLEEPFIPAGYGRFLYTKIIKRHFDSSHPENIPYANYPQAHNEFFSMLCALGVFGLILFVVLLGFTIQQAYKLFNTTSHHQNLQKIFSIIVFFGTFGFIGSLLFGSFFGDTEAKLFYCLLGILLGINYKKTHENHISKTV